MLAPDGSRVRLSSLVGDTPLLINVWASTCVPCRQEMPALQALADDLSGSLMVVGLDPLDTADEVAAFAADTGVTYPLYRDPDGVVQVQFGIDQLPTTLLVRADGTIAAVHVGALSGDELRRLVRDELGVG